MSLSDEELMLLEQLTYIDKNLCDSMGMTQMQFEDLNESKTVQEFVNKFDGHLDELSQMGDIPDYVYYQGNSNSLPDDAIVCFKGTLDGEEWKDNFLLKMGPADLLMRNTLKSLLDVDAESAETIKVQSGNG